MVEKERFCGLCKRKMESNPPGSKWKSKNRFRLILREYWPQSIQEKYASTQNKLICKSCLITVAMEVEAEAIKKRTD